MHVSVCVHFDAYMKNKKDQKDKNVQKNMGKWEDAFDNMIRDLHLNFESYTMSEQKLFYLDRAFRRFYKKWKNRGCTFAKLGARIKEKGICLEDCCVHGNISALRKAFYKRQATTIPIKLAKKYKFAQKALINIA